MPLSGRTARPPALLTCDDTCSAASYCVTMSSSSDLPSPSAASLPPPFLPFLPPPLPYMRHVAPTAQCTCSTTDAIARESGTSPWTIARHCAQPRQRHRPVVHTHNEPHGALKAATHSGTWWYMPVHAGTRWYTVNKTPHGDTHCMQRVWRSHASPMRKTHTMCTVQAGHLAPAAGGLHVFTPRLQPPNRTAGEVVLCLRQCKPEGTFR